MRKEFVCYGIISSICSCNTIYTCYFVLEELKKGHLSAIDRCRRQYVNIEQR